VNTIAERTVLAALEPSDDGLRWVRERATLAVSNRVRLIAELFQMGFVALPSAANFVMIPTPRATELFRALSSRGVLVRAFTAMPQDLAVLAESNGAALRIGVGPWEMMTTLLDTLREVSA
jgi:histidinol-phosphate aminotransferase